MAPDLQDIRWFALAVVLLLITYLSSVVFDASKTINPLGLPFRVVRPELMPIALILAVVYSAARFRYYGCVVAPSPWKRRGFLKGHLEKGCFNKDSGTYSIEVQRRKRARLMFGDFERYFPASDPT